VDVAVVVLVGVAMAVGLVGTVVPILPGLVLVAGAALVYGLAEGFGAAGTIAFAAIVGVGIAGTVAGLWLPHRAAGRAGASRQSLLLGAAGGVIGFFAVPVVGLPLGGVAGIYLGERLRTGDGQAAARTTVATLKGFGVAALVQLVAGVVMVLLWIGWVIAS
jgi:uncharacterized protein YqgC (DUF456 family)